MVAKRKRINWNDGFALTKELVLKHWPDAPEEVLARVDEAKTRADVLRLIYPFDADEALLKILGLEKDDDVRMKGAACRAGACKKSRKPRAPTGFWETDPEKAQSVLKMFDEVNEKVEKGEIKTTEGLNQERDKIIAFVNEGLAAEKRLDWHAIQLFASRPKNNRHFPHPNELKTGVGDDSESEQAKQKEADLLEYLTRPHTKREICKKFKMLKEEVDRLLVSPPEGHRTFRDIHSAGEDRFLCVPYKPLSREIKPRIWKYLLEDNGGSAVDIIFPSQISSKLSLKEKIRIVPISDVWFKHPLHDRVSFDARLAWIARSPHVFTFLNGDILHPFSNNADEIVVATQDLMAKLAPLAHKILWAQQGCFERKLASSKAVSFDPIDFICREWDIPYFNTGHFVGIHWGSDVSGLPNVFSLFCIHGRSTAQKKGTKLNAVVQVLQNIEFVHFVVMSHIKDAVFKKVMRACENRRDFTLSLRKQFPFICPSFVLYDGSRESEWGYAPPSRAQINMALYKDGDYHLYVASDTTSIVPERTDSKGGEA